MSDAPAIFKRIERLMGNRFELTVVCTAPDEAEAHLDAAVAEIRRIEALLTTYSDSSQTAAINAAAGLHPVQVDPEVFALIQRGNAISQLTQGAFDLSYGSADKRLWNFDTTMTRLPDARTARESVRLINWRNIVLDEEQGTVFLREPGMRIGFGGIGKGYAADRAKALLQGRGVTSGIVNASGDLTVWGRQPDGKAWTVGIVHPDLKGTPFSWLELDNNAIATSGNYEKFVLIDGKRYSHTIDPKTGLPVTGIKSVTVIAPAAELADALATPVTIMGINAGLYFMNQLPQVACLIIDDQNQLHTTTNVRLS